MYKSVKVLIVLLLLFLECLGFCKCAGGQQSNLSGKYVNCDYGYTVTIPSGLTSKIPGYYNHGFELDLPDRESSIEVYNAYNMSDSTVPGVVFRYELNLRKEGKQDWRLVETHTGRVHGLDSMQAKATYTQNGTLWKSEVLILYRGRQNNGLGNIVYVVDLSAPARLYETALPYLNETVEGFHLAELPLGPCSKK
jgi:hypothetical protein